MEPANLTPSEEARLDTLLRQAQPPLPDDGFSRRVLAALPPRLEARSSRRRTIFVAVGALTGYIIAFPHLNPWPSLVVLLNQFDAAIVASFSNLSLGFSLVVVVLSIFFAFFSNETENSRF